MFLIWSYESSVITCVAMLKAVNNRPMVTVVITFRGFIKFGNLPCYCLAQRTFIIIKKREVKLLSQLAIFKTFMLFLCSLKRMYGHTLLG